MSQTFAHLELRSPDLKQAQAFYAKLFGWELKPVEGSPVPYSLFNVGNLPSGGMVEAEPDGTPHWVPNLFVSDVDAAFKQALALRAKARLGPHEIPNYGTAAVLTDPAGSPFAIFKPNM